MFFISRLVAALLLCFCTLKALAVEVEAVGSAVIYRGDELAAYQSATRDAMRQASLQAGAKVSSTQVLTRGVITMDQLQVQSKGDVETFEVVEHWVDDGVMYVSIRADVKSVQHCKAGTANGYRKKVVVTGFMLAHPQQVSLGRLDNIERRMPGLLVQSLNNRGNLLALDAGHYRIFPNIQFAPATFSASQTLTNAVRVATQMDAQYVVSGVIRDLSMLNPDAPVPRFYHKPLDWVGLGREKRLRQFAFDLFIHDGITGALVFQQTYADLGRWDLPNLDQVGFASPRFWQTEFGEKMRLSLTRAVDELDATLSCQPFVSKILFADGYRLRFASGSNSGVRPGDTLNVYRRHFLHDYDYEQRTQLADVNSLATVKEVMPNFSIAELKVHSLNLNIRQQDVLIAW